MVTPRPAGSDRPAYFSVVGATVATQVVGSMALATVPVLAPEIAAELGVEASLIGIYTGLLFTAATLMLIKSGDLIARVGAVRTNQLAAACSGSALIVALFPGVGAVALAGILVGIGYGPNTPSSSQIIADVTPPHRRARAFSIKQSGAPLGAMLAGLLLPLLVLLRGWRAALIAVAIVCVLVAVAVEPIRRRVDRPSHERAGRATPKLAAFAIVLGSPALRRLTIGGFLMMLVHGIYQAFYVAYLVEVAELTLALAGALFASLQVAGAVARIGFGWLADRVRSARLVLVAVPVLASFEPEWTLTGLGLVSVLAGIGSSGWYGVFLAEIARLGPVREVGATTGGALFFIYWATAIGPFVVSMVVLVAGAYQPAWWLVGVLALIAGAIFARPVAQTVDPPVARGDTD